MVVKLKLSIVVRLRRHGRKERQREMTHRLLVLLCSVVVVIVFGSAVGAHLRVQQTTPKADSTISNSPQHLQVWFTQSPDPAVSLLSLEGPTGDVPLGATTAKDDKSLMATLPTALSPGSYIVRWRSAGNDGHTQRGEFSFTMRAAN